VRDLVTFRKRCSVRDYEIIAPRGDSTRAGVPLELARCLARAAPRELDPRGEFPAASTELELAATLGTPESRRALFWDRFEALVKSDQGAEARRVLDDAASDPGRDTTQLRTWTIASLNALVG
jgi:hypothetical protein